MRMKFTLSLLTENSIGMLSKISAIFTRRNINIESIVATKIEKKNMVHHTIVVNEQLDLVKKLVLQLEKQVEIIKVLYHQDKDIIYKEIALLKIKRYSKEKQTKLDNIISKNNAKVITKETDFIVAEITGNKKGIDQLINDLETFEIIEHIKSGRIAVSKP